MQTTANRYSNVRFACWHASMNMRIGQGQALIVANNMQALRDGVWHSNRNFSTLTTAACISESITIIKIQLSETSNTLLALRKAT